MEILRFSTTNHFSYIDESIKMIRKMLKEETHSSEGGRRPSERTISVYTITYMYICIYILLALLNYQHLE